jgi:hypothetical protein
MLDIVRVEGKSKMRATDEAVFDATTGAKVYARKGRELLDTKTGKVVAHLVLTDEIIPAK